MPIITMKTKSTSKYTYSVGRRRSAIAKVKLFSGKQASTVNQKPAEVYFKDKNTDVFYQKPFKITDTVGKYYFEASVTGGGKMSQLEAVTLGISRSLQKINPTQFTSLLRSDGLLTVDSRVRQRRKVGMGGKSRRKRQSPKR